MARRARLDVVLDCANAMALMPFWRDALGYRVHFAEGPLAVLVAPEGTASPLVLQQVPEPKTGKNRMHIDITTDDVEGDVTRLEGLGATRTHDGVQSFGGTRWVTMADPEGNEFCVCDGVEW